MSVLMEALNKAEELFERKQSAFDQTTDSSSNEIDEDLFLAEITDNETPKNTLPLMEDSTINERNEASLKSSDFKEIESQQPLPDSDQTIEQPFSLIDWQAPLENNETNTDSTSHNWDDEILPQFQNAIQEDNDKVDSTTAEPRHHDIRDFQEEIQEDSDKVDSTTAEPIHHDFRDFQEEIQEDNDKVDSTTPTHHEGNDLSDFDLSDFDNEQPLIDFKNEAPEIESTLADNLNQNGATATADSPQLKTLPEEETVTQTQPEFELDEKNTEATQTEQSLFLDEIFSSTATTVDTKASQTATTSAQKEKTLTQTQPDFDFKLEEKKSEETQTDQDFFLDETVPHPETARRILAASAAPQTPVSKRPLLLLTGVLTVLLVSMGTGYYYYSQSSLAEPFSFSTSLFPSVEKTVETEQASSAQKSIEEQNQVAATTETTEKQIAKQVTVNDPVKIAQSAQSENTGKKSLTQTQSKVTQPANQPNTDQKQNTAHQSFTQAIPKREQTLLKFKTPSIHTLRKNKVTQSINQALSTGYDAFQRGDDSTALRSYLNALRQDQNNRDALFGLAALALRSGNRPQAQHYYRRVLQLYPQDRHAQLGLINSLDNHATSSESQLKMLLEQAPQSAYIHFSLGNFYAAKGRWAQAQSAYFNAYRYDKTQADYAYNLAVSLDQLNQPSAALAYYQRALQQIQNQAIHFNPETVRQRMQTIKQHTQPSALEQM